MPFDNRRPERVAEAIREEVATFLADGVKDPRVRGMVTVTGVDLTRDLRHAKVFVSVLGDDAERADTMAGLAGIAAHLRGHVGRALRLRAAPEIAFKYDPSVTYGARLDTLFEQIRQDRGTPGEESGDGAASAEVAGSGEAPSTGPAVGGAEPRAD